MDEEKDKEFEIAINNGLVGSSVKLKNCKNRVVAKIGDIIVDKLSYYQWNNAVRFLDKYNKKKNDRKIQGKETPLPPKFILELLDNAIQEDEELIQNQWCNMLVNWQDLEKNCDQSYMYIELLKNLNLNEIKFLKLLSEDPNYENAVKDETSYYDKNLIKNVMRLNDEEYELMILNLFRLKICDSLKSSGNAISVGDLPVLADAGISKVRLTIIGYNLINLISD